MALKRLKAGESKIKMPVRWLLAGLLFSAPVPVLGQCPTTYEVDIIVPTCSEAGSLGQAISESGDIAGWYICGFGSERAFGWFDGPPIVTVPLIPGYTEMRAYAINPFGELAGYRSDPAPERPFLYSGGQSYELPMLSNPGGGAALSISQVERGKVVGYSHNPTPRAVMWQNGSIMALNLPVGPSGVANDINDLGAICGWMGVAPHPGFFASGFIWQNGSTIDLGVPPGGLSSSATGINNEGEVCGYAWVAKPPANVEIRGWLWANGKYTIINPLPGFRQCLPKDVNDDGTVVGGCENAIDPGDPDLPAPAFIWKNGVMTSLGELFPSDSHIVPLTAQGINNSGQVVGEAKDFQIQKGRAFRLTPIAPLVGDVNCDHSVSVLDLLAVINQWGQSNAPADLNQDGVVGNADLMIVIDNWT